MNQSIADVLDAIAAFCEGSLLARRVTRRFLDTSPSVGLLEIDPVATSVAGEDVFIDKPSDGLLVHLVALRALDMVSDAIGDGCVSGHNFRSVEGVVTPR